MKSAERRAQRAAATNACLRFAVLLSALCALPSALSCSGASRPNRIEFWGLGREGEVITELLPQFERETGIPLYDTVSTVVWKQLRMAGIDTRRVKGWGRLFQEVA